MSDSLNYYINNLSIAVIQLVPHQPSALSRALKPSRDHIFTVAVSAAKSRMSKSCT